MDKKTAYVLFRVMRGLGISRQKALEALFLLRGETVKTLSHRSDVSLQFVRLWISGKKKSRNLDRMMSELLFADPDVLNQL